jgi:putative FmdB family regulatory protein
MPTYEYNCSNCDITFEKFIRIAMRNRPLEEPCPECKVQGLVKQVIGSPKIVYETGDVVGRTDDGFKEVLSKINAGTSQRGNTITTK